jgi:hypothetical protein
LETPKRENDLDRFSREFEELRRSIAASAPQAAGGEAGCAGRDLSAPDGSATASSLPSRVRQTVHLASTWKGAVTVTAIIGFLLGVVSMGGLMICLAVVEHRTMPPVAYVCGVACSVVVSVIAALALGLRDALRQRLRAGLRVNPLLRLYFASGFLSWLVWIGTAVGLTFLMAAQIMR